MERCLMRVVYMSHRSLRSGFAWTRKVVPSVEHMGTCCMKRSRQWLKAVAKANTACINKYKYR